MVVRHPGFDEGGAGLLHDRVAHDRHTFDQRLLRLRLPACLRQCGTGAVEGEPGVGGVELHQHLAGLHAVAVVGEDGRHRAGHPRIDADLVAADIGVIGGLALREHQQPGQAGQREHGGDDQQQALAAAIAGAGSAGGGVGGHAHGEVAS
jgi:hypothetical protein